MKKFAKLFFAALAVCAVALTVAIAGCSKEKLSGELTVVIAADEQNCIEYTVNLENFDSSDHVSDVIIYLSTEENLYYKGTTSPYGIYLTELGTTVLTHNDEYDYDYEVQTPVLSEKYYDDYSGMEYIGVYTSVAGDTAFTDSVTYNGTQLGYSAFGVSSMKLEDGAVIYFTVLQYLF